MNTVLQRRILLIDDHREVLRALELGLELEGHDIKTAQTIDEAERLLSSETFDLVICDLLLPGMNGWDFRKMMAERMKLPPFIFCSGMAMEPMGPPFRPGIAGFLAKPFHVSDLINKMNEVFLSSGEDGPPVAVNYSSKNSTVPLEIS